MQYSSTVIWKRHSENFAPKTYNRTYHVHFPGGFSLEGSAAPEFLGNPQLPNPEELLLASLSSCFTLTFLYAAALKGLIIDDCSVKVEGHLGKNANGKMAVTEIIIKPRVKFFEDKQPERSLLTELFNQAHAQCFISNTVNAKVSVQEE